MCMCVWSVHKAQTDNIQNSSVFGMQNCKHANSKCALRLFACLGFNGTFSTNRLYRAIKVG